MRVKENKLAVVRFRRLQFFQVNCNLINELQVVENGQVGSFGVKNYNALSKSLESEN